MKILRTQNDYTSTVLLARIATIGMITATIAIISWVRVLGR